mmetsp:Transcript_8562/g.15172  ORF Transcript_8562/g.15172 Transcript_8562/m.15172 type:complete len:225 (+) Transcript_8562:647-1321(+)
MNTLRARKLVVRVAQIFTSEMQPGGTTFLLQSLDGIASGTHQPRDDAVWISGDGSIPSLRSLRGEDSLRLRPGTKAGLDCSSCRCMVLKFHVATPRSTAGQDIYIFSGAKGVDASVEQIFVRQRIYVDLFICWRRIDVRPIRERYLVDVQDVYLSFPFPPVSSISTSISTSLSVPTSRPTITASISISIPISVSVSVSALILSFSPLPFTLQSFLFLRRIIVAM